VKNGSYPMQETSDDMIASLSSLEDQVTRPRMIQQLYLHSPMSQPCPTNSCLALGTYTPDTVSDSDFSPITCDSGLVPWA
jgi:hypothetical protein